jgi:hypothetical protein
VQRATVCTSSKGLRAHLPLDVVDELIEGCIQDGVNFVFRKLGHVTRGILHVAVVDTTRHVCSVELMGAFPGAPPRCGARRWAAQAPRARVAREHRGPGPSRTTPSSVWPSNPVCVLFTDVVVVVVLCLLLQYLTQSCARGGRRIVDDMCKARIGCHDEGVVTCVALTP